jgi:hypothetical protein
MMMDVGTVMVRKQKFYEGHVERIENRGTSTRQVLHKNREKIRIIIFKVKKNIKINNAIS